MRRRRTRAANRFEASAGRVSIATVATDPPAAGSLAHRASIEARNPATLAPLGAVPVTSPDELPAIIAETARVQPLWARLRLEERAGYLRRAAQAVIDEFDEVADVVVAEGGRPRAEVHTL
jgi:acyl-CoA reductase-like NAD-dependent aldehyde dehydrogenase